MSLSKTHSSAVPIFSSEQTVSIQVLERAMGLLDALAEHNDPVALKDLAAATGLHTSTAHRILADLVAGRYVERVESGMYRLGMRLLELGSLVKGRLNVRDAAWEPMRELHRITGQTINLALQQGDEIVYVERAWNEYSGMQVVRAIGGRALLHLTSSGKLFLASCDRQQIQSYAKRTNLVGATQNSITQLEALERELAQVRRLGYARDNEELELGVRCLAAGVFDDTGVLQAGLSISAPSDRLREEWVPVMLRIAHQISVSLGYDSV